MGDFLYNAPADYLARLHSSVGGQSWLYVFEYEGTKSFGPIQRNAPQVSRSQYGATHMDDVFYLLPNEYIADSPQANDKRVSNTYANLLTILVQTGTLPLGNYGTYGWQQYVPQNPNYLIFPKTGANPSAVVVNQASNGYRTNYADFFNGFIYELQDKTARCPTPSPFKNLQ